MTVRTRYTAEYLYPGVFMPEETYRDLPEPTYEAAVLFGPDESGYFKKGGWYAVIIRTIKEDRYVSDSGAETWVRRGETASQRFIVGEKIHYKDIPGEDNDILRSNIVNNDKNGGYGVLTRCGNWQISSDWDEIVGY